MNQGTPNLTQEQYAQLITLLSNFHVNAKSGCEPTMYTSGAVNLAGIITCHSSMTKIGNLSCECEILSADSWILDFGSSHHMTYRKTLLTNITTLPYPFLVTLPNGYKVKVTEIGDVLLGPSLTLRRVLFIPSFKFNLISVHCLTLYLQSVVSFNKVSCVMQAPSLKRPLVIGRPRNGLYYFCPKCHQDNSSSQSSACTSSPTFNLFCSYQSVCDKNVSSSQVSASASPLSDIVETSLHANKGTCFDMKSCIFSTSHVKC